MPELYVFDEINGDPFLADVHVRRNPSFDFDPVFFLGGFSPIEWMGPPSDVCWFIYHNKTPMNTSSLYLP